MSDKRQFFRIQQDVIFNFKAVSTDSIEEFSAQHYFDSSASVGLLAKFQQLNNVSMTVMHNIRKENSDVGQYLEILNEKINLLSQLMLAQEMVAEDNQDAGRIDLSQGGIAFTTNCPLNIESWIALKLVFLPAYTAILSYAQITRSEQLDEDRYLVGASFDHLNVDEQRIIAKQIIETQIIQKKQSRAFKGKVNS
jgi:hypothetical protein